MSNFKAVSPYKGPPSPAVDAAWNALTDTYIVAIPPEALDQMNKLEAAVSFPPNSPKGAGGKYVGAVEVFHQLHCLDPLRKKTHEDYYKDKGGAWKDGAEILELHVGHCIDMLRVKLMCDSDVCEY